jgi:hypothetical protein
VHLLLEEQDEPQTAPLLLLPVNLLALQKQLLVGLVEPLSAAAA